MDEPRAAATRRSRAWRLGTLDLIRLVLLAAGLLCVATGALPLHEAGATMRRIGPILGFLGPVVILAHLVAEAELFDVVAARLARLAGGSYRYLFALCAALAAATTITLNLDTTAVLLTPVMLATARKLRLDEAPLAMTTIWLANTASLMLPVSNLTNLLAADRVGLAPVAFAHRMVLPAVTAITVTAACLWLLYWRPARRGTRYTPPEAHRAGDRVLLLVASLACAAFLAGVLLDVPLYAVSACCATALVVAFAVRRRDVLGWHLVPWQLLAFVIGLFLVVQTISVHGLTGLMRDLIGTDTGALGVLRAGGAGALLANLVNNLPSYVAAEAAVPITGHTQLLGLLVGTNVGPIVTPWASLATLLCYERTRADGVTIRVRTFVLTGAVTACCTLAATLAVLVVT